MCMCCYVFLSDESLLMWLTNNIISYIYSILTHSIIAYSSLADIPYSSKFL